MNELTKIINKYEIGQNGQRVSFLHSDNAFAALAEIKASIKQSIPLTSTQANWLIRLGECTKDAGIWAAVISSGNSLMTKHSHEFTPERI
jgi:hypothetical protein